MTENALSQALNDGLNTVYTNGPCPHSQEIKHAHWLVFQMFVEHKCRLLTEKIG